MSPEQSTQTDRGFYGPATAEQHPQLQPGTDRQQQQQEPKGQFQPYAQYGAGLPYQAYPAVLSREQQQQLAQQQYGNAYPPQDPIRWQWAKVALHAVIVALSVTGLGLSLSLLNSWMGTIATMGGAPVFGVAFLWSGAELITRLVRKWREGIHPGAHVGMCLVLWLGAAIIAGILWPYRLYSYEDEYCYNEPEINEYNDDCGDPFKGRSGELLGAAVLASILWLLEFALFIGACVDTAKRNNARGGRVVVVGAPPYWPAGPSAQGYEAMGNSYYAPQMAQQQPQMQTQATQDGQYMSVPQAIPLQTRSPSPRASASMASPPPPQHGEQVGESSRGAAEMTTPGSQMMEYYTPTTSR